ncbi:diaminopropionate ammonia-lyase [Saccharopolyspora shandongensis]|uniref:diaminopropionate ammonia-lyase n=1 Tax=Saccharopolyspora shandongensis TaxID=418495 RepID=UPI00343FEFC8
MRHEVRIPVSASRDLFVNERVDDVLQEAGPDRAPLDFHRRLPGYERTPVVELPDVAAELGVGRLWVKDESSRFGLMSHKVLGASYAIYRALCERLRAEPSWTDVNELVASVDALKPLSLAVATGGNHGLAVARMARLFGFCARVYVPANTVAARIEAIEREGAVVTVVDGDYDDAVRRSAEDESDRCLVVSGTSSSGGEQIARALIEGYSTIFWEIDDFFRDHSANGPDAVIVPVGVGALAAASVRHYRRAEADTGVLLVGVEPLAANCVLESLRAGRLVTVPGPHNSVMAGLNCGTPSGLAWPWLSRGIDVVVGVGDHRAHEAMRRLAAAGIVAGEAGAAGLGGLYELRSGSGAAIGKIGLHADAEVLIVVTEGATDPVAYADIMRTTERLPGSGPEHRLPGRLRGVHHR